MGVGLCGRRGGTQPMGNSIIVDQDGTNRGKGEGIVVVIVVVKCQTDFGCSHGGEHFVRILGIVIVGYNNSRSWLERRRVVRNVADAFFAPLQRLFETGCVDTRLEQAQGVFECFNCVFATAYL